MINDIFNKVEIYDEFSIDSTLFLLENTSSVITDPCLLAKLNISKAINRTEFNKYNEAIGFNNKALLEAKKCDKNYLIASAYNLKGTLESNLKLKIENYNEAKKYFYKSNKKGYFIDMFLNLASSYYLLDEYQKSIENALIAIPLIDSLKVKKIRKKTLYSIIAKSYFKQGEYNLAKEYANKSIQEIGKEDKTRPSGVYRAYKNVYLTYSNIYEAEKNFKQAMVYMKLFDSIQNLSYKLKIDIQTDKVIQRDNLKKRLDEEIQINNGYYKIILIGCFVFLIITILYSYNVLKSSNTLKKTVKEKEVLNNLLQVNLNDIQISNRDLKMSKAKIESLLKESDQSLFIKTLKVSNYKDAVQNVMIKVDNIVENNIKVDVSKLFFINKSLKDIISEEEIWEDFKNQFEKNRPDFFEKLLTKESSLSIIEQKHCAYVVMNLKSKEVATILNLSPRSVETTRYRIKKKLDLKGTSLIDFLKTI